jgi:hypothetical protein
VRTGTVKGEECSGFIIDQQIVVDGQKYEHLCSIMAVPRHFFTVITFETDTYVGGIDFKHMALLGEGGPFITSAQLDGVQCQPDRHIYCHVDDDEVPGGGSEDRMLLD